MLRWRSRDSSVLKRRLESNYGIQRKRSYRNSSWQEKKENKKGDVQLERPRAYGQSTAVADGAELGTQSWAETEMQADVGQAGLDMDALLLRGSRNRTEMHEVAVTGGPARTHSSKKLVEIRLCHSIYCVCSWSDGIESPCASVCSEVALCKLIG